MIEELNRFATTYGGLLGLFGAVTGLFGLGYGFYARSNPAPSKHKLLFKVFALELDPEAFVARFSRKRRQDGFTSYVDFWNCGTEPVTGGVIREPLSIGVQERDGQQLIRVDVKRESHPGVSQIRAVAVGNAARLEWAHLDPGMSARLEVVTKLPAAGDEIQIFGSGLRLEIVRARAFDDLSTLVGKVVRSVLIAMGLALFAFTTGRLLSWISSYHLSTGVWAALSIPVVMALILIMALSASAPLGLRALLGWVLNARSPIERNEGAPSLQVQMQHVIRGQQLTQHRMRVEHAENELRLKALLKDPRRDDTA
jgi:hypothetical protein